MEESIRFLDCHFYCKIIFIGVFVSCHLKQIIVHFIFSHQIMRYLVSAMLVIVGIIHLLPLSGILGSEKLSALYGISIQDTNLVILMRHRAVLFGLLGAFLIFTAWQPAFQTIAFIAGLISVVSFLLLAWLGGGYNTEISRVVIADIIALVCLIVAVIARFFADKAH